MTTEERLQALERELAALRAELAGSLTTRAVFIVGEQGTPRAVLGGAGGLTLFGEAGMVQVSADEDGPSLGLCDKNGKRRALLDVSEVGPGLSLCDAAGRAVWSAP